MGTQNRKVIVLLHALQPTCNATYLCIAHRNSHGQPVAIIRITPVAMLIGYQYASSQQVNRIVQYKKYEGPHGPGVRFLKALKTF